MRAVACVKIACTIHFYVGIAAPFTVAILCGWIFLIAVTIAVRRTLRKSQLWIPFLQSSSISILYGVGWTFGLSMTGLTGIGATVLGAFFIATGGLLGVYMFLIYGILSPTVRSIWTRQSYSITQKRHGKSQKPSTPIKQLLEASAVSEKQSTELKTPRVMFSSREDLLEGQSSIVIANISTVDSAQELSDKTDDGHASSPETHSSSEETHL